MSATPIQSLTENTAPPTAEEVWLQFSDALRGFIASRVKDADAVDDILHDVYLKLHRSIGNLRDQRRLSSYIFQIARNTITDHFRTSSRIVALEDDPPGDEQERLSPHRQVAMGLRLMILTLPPKYAQALLLSEIEGYTQAQVAEALGLSLSGAKSRVQRGRKLLKEALLDCCHFDFDRRGAIIDYQPRQCPTCPASPTQSSDCSC